jgi:hypothetical protein
MRRLIMNGYEKLNMFFYEASDGPRIMIIGPVTGAFQSLQQLFRSLSQCRKHVEIHREPFIRAFGGIQLVASCTGAMFQRWEGKPQGVRRRPSDVGPAFEWLRTEEGWDYLAELIDDLVKSTSPGHQYLSAYPREDAIVVVSKGEYGDEVLEYLDNPS